MTASRWGSIACPISSFTLYSTLSALDSFSATPAKACAASAGMSSSSDVALSFVAKEPRCGRDPFAFSCEDCTR
jgi:hypothetical protein